MNLLDFLENTIIVTGHYGCGKTNLSVNLAVDLKSRGKDVILVDLDIVNPYFRTADFRQMAEVKGIRLVASPYANSNVELPSLQHGLEGWMDSDAVVILDVGGDDAGAIALGGYAYHLGQIPYSMLYVVNSFRSMTRAPKEAADIMEDIETASRATVTHIVNNSNMGPLTTVEDVTGSIPWAQEVAALAGRELLTTSVKRDVAEQLPQQQGIYPVDIYVKTVWQ